MRHYKHIGLQADQEVKSCQACDMLPETSQLLLACQLLLCNLLLNLVMIVLNFNDNPTQEVSPWSNPYLSSHTIKISDYYHEFKSDSEFLNPKLQVTLEDQFLIYVPASIHLMYIWTYSIASQLLICLIFTSDMYKE